jgi:glycosyltransferase involved in cell wall biosynthesis
VAELSVIIPTQNDALVLEECLSSLRAVLLHAAISAEVLVVDDASTDGTVELAGKLSTRYPELHLRVLQRSRVNPGFGALVRYGLAYASGRYCALVSADGSDPVELLPTMVAKLRAGAQLVVSSRFSGGAAAAGVAPRYRLYQSVYRRAVKAGLQADLTDSTNGFRAFDRAFMQALGLRSTRLNVCPEMTFKTLLAGGELAYVEGQPRKKPGSGSDKFQLSNEILGYAVVLFRASLHRAGLRWF